MEVFCWSIMLELFLIAIFWELVCILKGFQANKVSLEVAHVRGTFGNTYCILFVALNTPGSVFISNILPRLWMYDTMV